MIHVVRSREYADPVKLDSYDVPYYVSMGITAITPEPETFSVKSVQWYFMPEVATQYQRFPREVFKCSNSLKKL